MLFQYILITIATSHLHLAKKITKLNTVFSGMKRKMSKTLLESQFLIKVILSDFLTLTELRVNLGL